MAAFRWWREPDDTAMRGAFGVNRLIVAGGRVGIRELARTPGGTLDIDSAPTYAAC